MNYFFRFQIGDADAAPEHVFYHSADDIWEIVEISACFMRDFRFKQPSYIYPIKTTAINSMLFAKSASALNHRLAIAKDSDRVLDVIGMTEEEWVTHAS
jgi:hypothetical protein